MALALVLCVYRNVRVAIADDFLGALQRLRRAERRIRLLVLEQIDRVDDVDETRVR